MDGKQNASPELPLPVDAGSESISPDQEKGAAPTPEVQSFGRESVSQQGPVVAAPMPDPTILAAQPTSSPVLAADPQTTADDSSHTLADDTDVIEKEWVEKAKAIVAKTHSDPRKQSTELNKFKAEYIKKRFHKDLKVAEEAA